eukprot:1172968-Prorocentrum_minimum.AAC.1
MRRTAAALPRLVDHLRHLAATERPTNITSFYGSPVPITARMHSTPQRTPIHIQQPGMYVRYR